MVEPRDSFAVRDIALHFFDNHNLEMRSDKAQLIDNDFRQMLDSFDGLANKVVSGGIVVLFLSTAAACCGFHDWLDPFTFRRSSKDGEAPVGYTNERFSLLPRDRMLFVWLDPPDKERIAAKLNALEREHWAAYIDVMRMALASRNHCIVSDGNSLNWNRVDDTLVRIFHLAYTASPSFRDRFVGGMTTIGS
jgi:hypothetical protein